MKVNKRSIVFGVLTLVIFTVLPLYAQSMIPQEYLRGFSSQGFDLADLVNKVAFIGLVMSVLILLKGFFEKTSATFLALSIVSTVFWLLIVFFALGMGKMENLGLTVLSSEAGGVSNTVIFDLRLFAYLATIIVGLKIFHSILKFREARLKRAAVQTSQPSPTAESPEGTTRSGAN